MLWHWRGSRLTEEAIGVRVGRREQMNGERGGALAEHLTKREVIATRRRIERLLSTKRHPQPTGDWPAMPWPPF